MRSGNDSPLVKRQKDASNCLVGSRVPCQYLSATVSLYGRSRRVVRKVWPAGIEFVGAPTQLKDKMLVPVG